MNEAQILLLLRRIHSLHWTTCEGETWELLAKTAPFFDEPCGEGVVAEMMALPIDSLNQDVAARCLKKMVDCLPNHGRVHVIRD